MKIPHSMISHISNKVVLDAAGSTPLSDTLFCRQLALFGTLAALPNSAVIRILTFNPLHVAPLPFLGKRRRGRPRLTWMSVQHSRALALCNNSQQSLDQYFQNLSGEEACLWRKFVAEHA